ncbi:hypothetical protein A3C67_00345 [Candidatus Nomurabacteria bacterium RIFCSPHIGHO2_02_FULL_42_19]|uniref:Uncharacterized protein n=1 Tax=Candidatus Nomurabacteria bacterium RIFCSPHIGHO2_02_FULL_42_19 TaxID=1801756 RepID=A0A1F6W312_9BACT|nr:MAG: hypothetical protein A3C67_00345 [Candidatus Nomurabacteria bacterium RIFCSPHIGHO2_02_FULL_42_19]
MKESKKIMNDDLKNPFRNYMDSFRIHEEVENPVHEIVNIYYEMRRWDNMPKKFYEKKERSYPKLAHEAKMLYEACEEELEDAVWALDKMKYLADKGGFDWSIITCLKHKLK